MQKKAKYLPVIIELSTNSLKLLQLGRLKSSYEILKADYVNLDRKIKDLSLIQKNLLQKMVKDNNLKGEAVTSIQLAKINTYAYLLPNMPLSEIESALTWKIRQNLAAGVNFEDISFDYVYRVQPEGSKDIDVSVFILPKKSVQDMVRLFKEATLDLISIEPQPYAIIEVLASLKKLSDQETVLILYIDSSSSFITIVSSGHPFLMKQLNISGDGFTEAVANYFELDWPAAEELKIKEGLGDTCLPVLSSQLENLIIDVEHTFKYFCHQLVKFNVQSFDRVILCGGSSQLKNLDKFLAEKLLVPVAVFDPLEHFVTNSKVEINPVVKAHSASFSSALGLTAKFIDGDLIG